MIKKTFNSKTAENLAKKYKLTLEEIKTTRKNKKITIKNVKDARKEQQNHKKTYKKKQKKNKSKSPIKEIIGYNVILKVNPKIDKFYTETIRNMTTFKQWIEAEENLPAIRIISSSFQNEKVKILDNKTLEISFYVDNKTRRGEDEVKLIIDCINGDSLDDDGNYPVFTDKSGEIFLKKIRTPTPIWGHEDMTPNDSLVSIKILDTNIEKVYN